MSKPTNPECEVYWAQIVCEAEDSRSQNPDDTVFFRTVLMLEAGFPVGNDLRLLGSSPVLREMGHRVRAMALCGEIRLDGHAACTRPSEHTGPHAYRDVDRSSPVPGILPRWE